MRYSKSTLPSPLSLDLRRVEKWTEIRRVRPFLLLPCLLMVTACSYITDFVVVNESMDPIELRYKIKNLPGPFRPRIMPAKRTTSQLREGDKPWQQLDSTQYTLDPENRSITVHLMPNEALRIERMQRGGMQIDESEEAKTFSIEELSMRGRNGEIKFEGDRVRRSFVAESKKTYILLYK